MRVLVVCTANIARSPLAAAMLRSSLDPRVDVVSAGTRARDGDRAAGSSEQLAAARGLDLSAHRSQPVTAALVADADLVLTMSQRQRDRCAPLAAGAGARTFTVRELLRLLGAVDLTDVPDDPGERLAWVGSRAHRMRPVAPPARVAEDVDDPIAEPWPAWLELGTQLDDLIGQVVWAAGGVPGWQPIATTPPVSARGGRTAARRRLLRWPGGAGR